MKIIQRSGFSPITSDGTQYTLHHLQPFTKSLPKNSEVNTKLVVRVRFHSHVFSVIPKPIPIHAIFLDEGGKNREFCPDRYSLSLNLKSLIGSLIDSNTPSWISRDRNQANHYAVCELPFHDGEKYHIFYDLHPSRSNRIDVELSVKSAYLRDVNFKKTGKRTKVISLIRECHYKQKALP